MKFYIYYSDNRPYEESEDFQGLFKKFIKIVRNEKSNKYISFGVTESIHSCDLAFSEWVEREKNCHIVFSNDNLKSEKFNNNLININVKNIMIDLL